MKTLELLKKIELEIKELIEKISNLENEISEEKNKADKNEVLIERLENFKKRYQNHLDFLKDDLQIILNSKNK